MKLSKNNFQESKLFCYSASSSMLCSGISNEMTNFHPILLMNQMTNKAVGEFVIHNITITQRKHNTLNQVAVSVFLLRSRFSIFMVTYLPTILMNLINQVFVLNYKLLS